MAAERGLVGLVSISDHHHAWSWRPDVLVTVAFENVSLPFAPVLRCADGVEHPLHVAVAATGPSLLWNASERPPSILTQRTLRANGVLHSADSRATDAATQRQALLLLLRPPQLAYVRTCQLAGAEPLRRARAREAASPLRALRLARVLASQLSASVPRTTRAPDHGSCSMPLLRQDRSPLHTSFLHIDGGNAVGLRRDVGSSVVARLRSGARLGVSQMQQLGMTTSTTACASRMQTDIADSLATTVQSTMETTFVMALIKGVAIPLLMLLCIPFVMALLDALMPYLSPVLGPGMVASAEPILVMFLYPKIYGPVGNNLIESATKALNARVGAMLCRSLAFHLPRILTASIPPKLTEYMMKSWAPEVAKSLLYNTLHALTHSLTHSISHHLTQAVAQGVTHSITHALVHYYYCIYCYKSGDFCRYCYYCEPRTRTNLVCTARDSRPSD
tara:strand:- start:659 stop:2002 length:1344 start_codon:yes stop_codon:yes gene_type:complete